MIKLFKSILGIGFVALLSACNNGSSSNNSSNTFTQISGPASAAIGAKGPSTTLNITLNSASLGSGLKLGTGSPGPVDDIQVTNISPAAPGLSVSNCISGSADTCNITLSVNGSVAPGTYTLTIQGSHTSAVTTRLTVAYPKLSLSSSAMTKTTQSMVLTNASSKAVPLDVTSLAAGTSGWSITNDNCSGRGLIAKGQTCTFTINSANTNPKVSSNINIGGDYFSASPYTPTPVMTTAAAASSIAYTAPTQASSGKISFTQQSVTFQVQNTASDPTAISIPVKLTYNPNFAGGLSVSTSGTCNAGSGGINYYVPANSICSITLTAADIATGTSGSTFTITVGATPYLYNLVVPGITGSASIASDHSTDGEAAYEKIEVTNNTSSTISNLTLNFNDSVSNLIENAAPSTSGESATNCPTGAGTLASGATCYFWLHALQQTHPTITTGRGLTVSVNYTEGGVGQQTSALPIVAATYLYAIGDNGVYAWDGNSNDDWQTLATIGNGMSGLALQVDPINGNLYAGGAFDSLTQPGQSPTISNNLAYWDGYAWQPAWQGLGGAGLGKDSNAVGVLTLAETTAGELYAGGAIDNNIGTTYVASIDTTAVSPSWSDISGTLNAQVNALALDTQNNLYAGGVFSLFVAEYENGAWNTLSSPSTIAYVFNSNVEPGYSLGEITSLLFNNTQLLAGATDILKGGVMTWSNSTTGWGYINVNNTHDSVVGSQSFAKFNNAVYLIDDTNSSIQKINGNSSTSIAAFSSGDLFAVSIYADNSKLYIGAANTIESSNPSTNVYIVDTSSGSLTQVNNSMIANENSINNITEGPYLCVGDTTTCPAN